MTDKETTKTFELPTIEECEWVMNVLEERNPNIRAVPLAEILRAAILVWQGQRGGMHREADEESMRMKIGPFLCEWCNKPMKSLKGKREEDGKWLGVGRCRDCGEVWSKPVEVPRTM